MCSRGCLGFLLACVVSTAATASAEERIVDYHSDILVREDGSLIVSETIRVLAQGNQIKRGIYREFPMSYRDRHRNRVIVGFEVLSVQRDGNDEAFHTENVSNGVRVYAGQASVFVAPGEHKYTLVYRTTRQLGFFETHDELYFNVTGNGWAFPIDHASASVTLPANVPRSDIRVEGYTGPQGSTAADLRARVDSKGVATFETTRALGPSEGLTIVVMWPKGFVRSPTTSEKIESFFDDNRASFVALLGLMILLIYLLAVWSRVGRDPEKGTIIPRYHPPKDLSPGAARFVVNMGYDHKCFAAALIDLGVKGLVRLIEADENYTVQRVASATADLPKSERVLLDELLGSRASIELVQRNHAVVGGALTAFKRALANEFERKYFVTNSRYLVPGVLWTVAVGAATMWASSADRDTVFLGVWLLGWTVGVVFLVVGAALLWRSASGKKAVGQAVFMTLFAIPFVLAELFVLGLLAGQISILAVLALVSMVLLSLGFYQLLKAPTRLGRKAMDALEGFRMYLSVAEQDRLALMKSPEKTPELFEAYLPYALALDVEQAWAEQFSDVLSSSARSEANVPYHPTWYSGRASTAGAIGAVLGGSLSSAISSSSTAPGSSSGGGGGGSSGGGGGGGGGGGW